MDKSSPNPIYKVVSIFSGCGGLDLGFEGGFRYLNRLYPSNKFKVVFANDIMPSACESLSLNFSTPTICCEDIKSVIGSKKTQIPSADIVIGGFPCQDFSLAGKRKGFQSERGKLYKQMKRVIEHVKPKIFVAENVRGLMNLGSALQTIKSDFENSNPKYRVDSKLLMAADFGVPQTRERIIIVGVREDLAKKMSSKSSSFKFPFPRPTNSNKNEDIPKWISVKEAIEDLDGPNSHLDRQDQFSRAKNYGSHLQGNRLIDPEKPSPTIRAEHHGNIEFHYKGHRRLTVRECARIQTFPDDFKFGGSASKAYVQIGNAVPPVLGWHVAKSIRLVLDKYDKA